MAYLMSSLLLHVWCIYQIGILTMLFYSGSYRQALGLGQEPGYSALSFTGALGPPPKREKLRATPRGVGVT